MSNSLKIRDVCSRFSSGKSISASSIFEHGKYPVFGGNGLRGYTDMSNFTGECAVIGRQGAYCGNVLFYSGKAYMTEHAIVAVANQDNNSRYLAYKFETMDLGRYAGQSAQPGLSVTTLLDIDISVPSKELQDAVVDVLAPIDAQIANNNAICEELEAMTKLLYDYWFVQFDFPDENGNPYKSSGGRMVWNDELGREMPEGWIAGRLSDLGRIVGGATPSTSVPDNYTSNGIAWATPKDLADNGTLYFSHGSRDLTEGGLQSCSAELMPSGTVLMTSRAPIGYTAIAANMVCTNQGFKSIVPNKEMGTYYVYFTLELLMPYIKSFGVGSTFAEVSKQDMSSIPCLIPDVGIINKYNCKVESYFTRVLTLEDDSKRLTELREFLLPLLMSGQVTVEMKGGA